MSSLKMIMTASSAIIHAPLQSIDRNERVIYMGTFSKSLAPGLRMAYMVLPSWLLDRYNELFARYKSAVPRMIQHVMALFMSGGHWEKHLRKISISNKKKHDLLVHAIQKEMGDKVRILGHNAGLHVLIEFIDGKNQEVMVERAAVHGVKVSTTCQYWHRQENVQQNLIIMGFGVLT